MKKVILILLLLLIFSVLSLHAIVRTSGTCDEIAHHIPVGVLMLIKGDLKVDTSQPPLSRYLVALPIVSLLNPQLPSDRNVWRVEDRASFGRDFFFRYNHRSRVMLLLGRFPIMLIGLACGVLIVLWAHELSGPKAALLSLFLYAFSPDILAHASLATTDMVASFAIFLSAYTLWRFFRNKNASAIAMAGIALGLAQLSKYSALILYPIYIGFAAAGYIVEKKNKFKLLNSFIMIFLLSIIIMWAGYGFRVEPVFKNAMRSQEKAALIDGAMVRFPFWTDNAAKNLDSFLQKTPVPLGEHLLGIMGVLRHGQSGHRTFFMGRWRAHGNIFYFPAAFLIKTPVPLILLLIAGFFSLRSVSPADRSFLIIPPLVYFLSALFSNLQIGVRHLLPLYPFLILIAGRSIFFSKKKITAFLLVFLCSWYGVGTLLAGPSYLSYFNEMVGGARNGWKYLRDSNIDWGQDLPALASYLRKSNHDTVTLCYFGEDDPSVYGIRSTVMSKEEFSYPRATLYAISVNMLDSVAWASEANPVAYAGGSIHIYDFSEKK